VFLRLNRTCLLPSLPSSAAAALRAAADWELVPELPETAVEVGTVEAEDVVEVAVASEPGFVAAAVAMADGVPVLAVVAVAAAAAAAVELDNDVTAVVAGAPAVPVSAEVSYTGPPRLAMRFSTTFLALRNWLI
jgi:hypothetical protein